MILEPETRQKLINRIMNQINDRSDAAADSIQRLILLAVAEEFSGSRLTFQERKEAAAELFHSMCGLDILQPLMDDPMITEIMVNGPDHVFFEKSGHLHPANMHFDNRRHLAGVITNFFGRANQLIHEKKPLADMRLPDGSRVHAALPPAAPDGPVLTIRKFTGMRPDMPYLIDCGFITAEAADFLVKAIRSRQTLFICGGTGTGKTTFLNILSGFIPPAERIITIEDAAELALKDIPNVVRLEARQPGPDGEGEIRLADLIRASLRMRPDRIIVGEVRGREAFDMLQAMNTGHPGSLCTGHGNSCQDMLARLSLMVLMAVQLPWDAIHGLISSALDIVIHLERSIIGKRQVSEICRILPGGADHFLLQPVFRRMNGGELKDVSQGESAENF